MEEDLEVMDYVVIKYLLEIKVQDLQLEILKDKEAPKITYQLLEQYKKTLKKIQKKIN